VTRGAAPLDAPLRTDTFPGVLHFGDARSEADRRTAGRRELVELEIKDRGLAHETQPDAPDTRDLPRHARARDEQRALTDAHGRDQNGGNRRSGSGVKRPDRRAEPDLQGRPRRNLPLRG